jgi:hypothetical protein
MPEIFFTRHAKNRMRWRGISRETVELIIENPERVEDKGNEQFNYFKQIKGNQYKVFCVKEENRIVILSAIKK